MSDLTPAQLLAATAADMRAVLAVSKAAITEPAGFGTVMPEPFAVAVADWLGAEAERYRASEMQAVALATYVAVGFRPPMLRVCDAWWKSRGMEPRSVEP